jgi:hypothetical protein
MTGGGAASTRSEDDLDRALDRGAMRELPPNHPPGWLGEVAPDMRKAEEFVPTLNAGVVQEHTPQTRWLLILVFYAMLFTAPVAAWLLWKEPRVSVRAKIVTTVLGVAGYVALYWATAAMRLGGA